MMTKRIINVDKKILSIYKDFLTKSLIIISKYGPGKDKEDILYMYNIIDESNMIYPIIMVNDNHNSLGDDLYPNKFFMVPNYLPKDIDIYHIDTTKYKVTNTIKVCVSTLKKDIVPSIKNLSIIIEDDKYSLDIPDVEDIGYINVNMYSDIKSISSIIKCKNFTTINDKNQLTDIHANLLDSSYCSVHSDNGNYDIKLFFNIAPIKMDLFEFCRRLDIIDNEITSTIYCKVHTGNIIIHNFYKYIDIWSIINNN